MSSKSDRSGWLKYREVQVEHIEEQPLSPSLQPDVQWLFNKKMNPESKDCGTEVLILSQPHSLSAETIWLFFVCSFLTQGAMPSCLHHGPASIGCSQHTLFFLPVHGASACEVLNSLRLRRTLTHMSRFLGKGSGIPDKARNHNL